jgi:DNA phosphorothioation-dependent restriction protein DptH
MIGSEPMYEGAPKTAQRVSGVFSEVYSMGDQQKSALYEAVKRGISASSEGKMTFEELIHYLEEMTEEKGAIGASAGTVISKIRPFVDQNPFGAEDPESWERLFTDVNNRCHIIQLTGFLRDASRLITEFSLIDLYWFYRGRGSKDAPRVIVLDEVQNLDHRDESPLAQLLTEGRKFGFSLILATQIMSSLEKDERDRLFNAGHKLFFRPVDTEVRTYADIAAISSGEKADEWVKRLASLKKGECYSLGPSLNESTGKLENKAFKIRITSLAERINV